MAQIFSHDNTPIIHFVTFLHLLAYSGHINVSMLVDCMTTRLTTTQSMRSLGSLLTDCLIQHLHRIEVQQLTSVLKLKDGY